MSRQEKKWNKPGHSSWGKMQSSRPPGLRGKQIGLYFRDQKRRARQDNQEQYDKDKIKKQFVVRLCSFYNNFNITFAMPLF